MSIQAIAWVFEQDIRPSPAKFVLVGLCNYIQPDGTAWCALGRLAAITSQDIKTVRNGLRSLEELGHIRKTGKTAGSTGQIPLYQVRLPDAVFLSLGKGTGSGRKGYRIRSAKGTASGTRSVIDPLLSNGEKNKNSNVEQIAEHLAKLKKALKT